VNEAVETAIALIEARLEGHTDRGDEAAILATLSTIDDATLDAVLSRLDLARLLGDVDDRTWGPKHRTELDALLTVDRIDALGVPTRAALIAALQRGRTGSRDEAAIERLLLATRGCDLTALKNLVDAGADHHDLQQLLFSDIDDDDRRSRLLAHFAAEAVPSGEVKVLSDIDDTFYANWKDERFPAKTVYPGVLQLYEELDRGPDGDGRPGDIAFVTARPKDRPGLVEKLTHGTLRERGIEVATVLSGSFRHLLTDESIAEEKLANFRDYAALFPEYDFVFLGDSGQGDASFGKRMIELSPERVAMVLIHDVVQTPTERRRDWNERGVVFVDSYVGAATEAYRRGLVSADGVRRVMDRARADLERIPFEDEAQRDARRTELEADCEAADAALAG